MKSSWTYKAQPCDLISENRVLCVSDTLRHSVQNSETSVLLYFPEMLTQSHICDYCGNLRIFVHTIRIANASIRISAFQTIKVLYEWYRSFRFWVSLLAFFRWHVIFWLRSWQFWFNKSIFNSKNYHYINWSHGKLLSCIITALFHERICECAQSWNEWGHVSFLPCLHPFINLALFC